MYRPLARSVLEKSLPILMPRKRRSQNSPEHSGYQQLSARSYPMKRRLPPEPCGLSKTTRRTPNSKPTRIQALNLSTDLGALTGEKPAWLAPTHATTIPQPSTTHTTDHHSRYRLHSLFVQQLRQTHSGGETTQARVPKVSCDETIRRSAARPREEHSRWALSLKGQAFLPGPALTVTEEL